MEDSALPVAVTTILAVVAPAVISLIKQTTWPRIAIQGIVVAVSIAFACVSLALTGQFDGDLTFERFIGHAAYIAAVSQLIYNVYFKGTALNRTLETIGSGR